MKSNSSVAAALLFALAILAACGGQEQTTDTSATMTAPDTAAVTTDTTDTATATHPASPGGTAIIPSVAAGTTIVALIEDGRIVVQTQNIPPGPAVITVTNGSPSTTHNLFVEGQGISRAAGDPIPEKTSRSFEVNLQTGTYTLYCPILDHRGRGEETTMTVGGAPGATPTTTDTTGTTAGASSTAPPAGANRTATR